MKMSWRKGLEQNSAHCSAKVPEYVRTLHETLPRPAASTPMPRAIRIGGNT